MVAAAVLAAGLATPPLAGAQESTVDSIANRQIAALQAVKAGQTATESKIDSKLLVGSRRDPRASQSRNGTTATVTVPFGPLRTEGEYPGLAVEPLLDHVRTPRLIALLLVRKGGHSLGLAYDGRVVLSRTDRHHGQGRTAAGGWSQQRFARRREGQTRAALRSAAQDAFEVLLPRLSEVDAVVLGGDRRALGELRADRRLATLFDRAEPRVLEIPEPRREVLAEAARRARAAELVVREPTAGRE